LPPLPGNDSQHIQGQHENDLPRQLQPTQKTTIQPASLQAEINFVNAGDRHGNGDKSQQTLALRRIAYRMDAQQKRKKHGVTYPPGSEQAFIHIHPLEGGYQHGQHKRSAQHQPFAVQFESLAGMQQTHQ